MKVRYSLLSDARGSYGGATASRSSQGQYMRARVTPVNPRTNHQVAARDRITQLSHMWSSDLDQDQRDGWNLYARNVPLHQILFGPQNVSGVNMFVRSNALRLQASQSIIKDAPTEYVLPVCNDFDVSYNSGSPGTIDVSFDDGQDWVSEDGAALLVYAGIPKSSGTHFFHGPYRLAGAVLGDSGSAPTSPVSMALDWDLATGNKSRSYGRLIRSDGRASEKFLGQLKSTP